MRPTKEKSMNRRVLVLLSVLVLLTSGCITIRIDTRINENGSGSKSFVLAFDKSVMSMMESMAEDSGASVDDFWAEVRDGADTIQGATVEDYSDDESEGIKVAVPFDSLEELEALSGSDAFEGADVVTISQDGDTTTLKAVVSLGDITSGLDESAGEGLEDFDLGDIEFEYSYALDVEGDILDYAPEEFAKVEGSKVTWDLTKANADTVELMLKWEPGGGFDPRFLLLALAAVGGLALVVIGVALTIRGKQTEARHEKADRKAQRVPSDKPNWKGTR
jgi:hypothetical protein